MADPVQTRTRSLRSLVISGLGWKAFSQLTVQAIALGTTVVVARLITPDDLGLATMALVFSSLGFLLGDIALGAALIQRERVSEEDRSTAFWTSAGLGVLLTGLGIALSGQVADLYGQPSVGPLFAVLSFVFLLGALGTVPSSLRMRELRFRGLELRIVLSVACGSVAAIVVAALGYGPWAIIVQQLVQTGIYLALLWLGAGWHPRFVYSRSAIRSLTGFGGPVVGTQVLFYVHRNLDNFLVGRYLGAAALGAYSLAYKLMLVPLVRVASPVTQVFYPAFSRIRDPARIGSIWLRAVRMVAVLIAPAMLGVVVVAPELIPVVFGDQWHDAVPVVQILAPVGLVQSLQTLNASILQALGRPGVLFRFSLVSTVLTTVGFVAGLPFGIVGVATGYAIASVLLEPYYLWRTARVVGVPIRAYLRAFSGVAEAALLMALAVFVARIMLVHSGISSGVILLTLIGLGVAVYVPLLLWRVPELMDEIRRLREPRSDQDDVGEADPTEQSKPPTPSPRLRLNRF